jgi:hypothetical protein
MTQPYAATLRGYTVGDAQTWEWTSNPQLGMGEYRAERATIPGQHGTVATSGDYGGPGLLEWELEYVHPEVTDGNTRAATAEMAAFALRNAWRPHEGDGLLELTVQMQSGIYVYRGRPLRPAVITDEWGYGTANVKFDVLDPLMYAVSFRTAFVGLVTFTGGFDSPIVTPIVTTSSGSTGDAFVINEGYAPAPWTALLSGPLTNPRLILNGQSINIVGDIPAGSNLSVDSRTGRVELDGAMRPWVVGSSTWWDIPPGPSTFSLRADSGSGSATLSWRDAYY